MTSRYIKITIVFTMLIAIIMQCNASEINGIRYYSDSDKTRIVILLDKLTQYQTNYDKENNLIISMPKSQLDTSNKSIKINDPLINSVTLNEVDRNTVNVNISFKKPAKFSIFPLESPNRIVIDLSPYENIITQIAQDTTLNSKQIKVDKPKETNPPEPFSLEHIKSDDNVNEASSLIFGFPYIGEFIAENGYIIIQIGFDLMVMGFLLYMMIRVKEISRVSKLLKKHRKVLKENQGFTDMLNDMEKIHKKDVSTKAEKNPKTIAEKEQTKSDFLSDTISFPKQYEKVQELAQRGLDPLKISQKSNIPVGEVNLILDLIKSRKEG